MPCFKLWGQRVAARAFDYQKTEIKISAATRNRCPQIGTLNTIRVPKNRQLELQPCTSLIM